MFHSLRSRLFVSYIILILLSLSVAVPALSYLLRGYQNRLMSERLDDIAVPLISQMKDLSQQGRTPQEILVQLSSQAEELGVRLLVLQSDGRVMRDTSRMESLEGQQLRVPAGRISVNPWQPDRGKYTDIKGRSFIYSAVMIRGGLGDDRPQNDGVALVIAHPETGALRTLGDLIPILFLSTGVAFVAALIIGSFLTRSILRPVTLLTRASEEIARGQYDQRVNLTSPAEFKHLADSFNTMAYEVGHSRQLLRDFLANVAHELKTPLTSIRGFVQAQLDGTVQDQAGRENALRIVDGEAARLQRLVAELLELSRLEAGQIGIAREPVNLKELTDHCVEVFVLRAEDKDVRMLVDLPQSLQVMGDFDRMEQVLSNLIDNALRHLNPGGQVKISARQSPKNKVTISVADNGPGIEPRELPHIFERFYTASDRSQHGTGLGLAIAREIIRAHGGELTVESIKGNGTTFVMTLPVN